MNGSGGKQGNVPMPPAGQMFGRLPGALATAAAKHHPAARWRGKRMSKISQRQPQRLIGDQRRFIGRAQINHRVITRQHVFGNERPPALGLACPVKTKAALPQV
jgi:hypothetical protein